LCEAVARDRERDEADDRIDRDRDGPRYVVSDRETVETTNTARDPVKVPTVRSASSGIVLPGSGNAYRPATAGAPAALACVAIATAATARRERA